MIHQIAARDLARFSSFVPTIALKHQMFAGGGAGPLFAATAGYSLAGWPSATVRRGTSPGGLPIGLQVAEPPSL
jgi:amidase